MRWNQDQLEDLKKRLFEDRDICPHAIDEIISVFHWWMIDHDLLLSANMTFELGIESEERLQ
jgi:hypothetical protein